MIDGAAEFSDLWRQFAAIQLVNEEPGVHPNAHELHARMCFLAGATGAVFRMNVLLGQDPCALLAMVGAAQDLQWELKGLMAAFQASRGGKAKEGGDG